MIDQDIENDQHLPHLILIPLHLLGRDRGRERLTSTWISQRRICQSQSQKINRRKIENDHPVQARNQFQKNQAKWLRKVLQVKVEKTINDIMTKQKLRKY